ncbi:uncharacterized protein AMSG_03040 [Thecamonas trahens ATCC 50062]|uniref:Glutaredoxin domain-containing protein n=1 Tax=Thecamonas trahens ATCC 50062 TaxID=461836 RepID=A0A0L0D5M7_THETB|nr:hypothetical protein AMSG_03040 [Thecamonas trahens ATCC 50062]KNC46603.1 hypothetical protein AMSG_03040 [Thecamonas trahens ATCC 50062]|eukprot:XP_013760378.1 hypothetical protein AMSG_03040 [Thecamonas trahens ATCC 50062]
MATKQAVLLISSYGGNLAQEKNTKKVVDWCEIKKVKVEMVDGADADNRDLRNTLWGISGSRGYPQMFIKTGDDYAFVGDYDGLEGLIETETWDAAFDGVESTEA